ncbi:uncharacterized protein LOC125777767 isoform X2 [Bactrocera dorsalis]|uniref:Uncharacterized protein LOC125777767 isoform X2 n=1 Tax=Bactrocera dorsalis TaxID=27457 RepID=A0ABM3JJ73_BACDO|nr:uncharacterized protein LOC125777767 isoform X2 [Bactrocera dorsalis]
MGEYNRRDECPIFQEEENEERSLFWILKRETKRLNKEKKETFGGFKYIYCVQQTNKRMPEKAEVQAQSKLLRECRVIAAKTHHSISRITGDLEDEHYLELASKLPMSSEEHVRFVEEKLSQKESTDAMMRLILKSKGAKGSVDGVLRGLFSDDVMYHYNLEGRKEKKSLLKLKCVGLVFDIFPDKDKNSIYGELRRFVALSHNRYKQKKHKLRAKLI